MINVETTYNVIQVLMCANKERGWGERDDDTLSNTLVILVLLLKGEPIVMGHRMS